jgi:4a-hydroxytetrahydrobiopterin dehydratase
MRPSKLDSQAVAQWLDAHAGWEKTRAGEQEALARTYKLPDFSAALGLVVRVGLAAEKRDHHPDVELGWGRARFVWTTHDQKGITSLDTELAEVTDGLAGSFEK